MRDEDSNVKFEIFNYKFEPVLVNGSRLLQTKLGECTNPSSQVAII